MEMLDLLKEKDLSKNIEEFIDKYLASLQKEDKYIDKFHSLETSEKDELLKKLRKKYESDEYQVKEYRAGYEPRMPLYGLLLRYSEKYGKEHEPDLDFCTEKYTLWGTWVIRLFQGQGAFIVLDPIKEDRYEDRRKG